MVTDKAQAPALSTLVKQLQLRENSEMKIRNELINSMFTMSLEELKMLSLLVANVYKNASTFDTFSVSAKELAEAIGVQADSYTTIRATAEKLISRKLQLRQIATKKRQKPSFLFVSWFSYIAYIGGTGRVEYRFNDVLAPYLLKVTQAYVRQLPQQLMSFKSFYTGRLFLLFRQWEKLETKTIDIEELKALFDVQDKYRLTSDFLRYVIQPSVKEVNKTTNLTVTAEANKDSKGWKYTTITFTIRAAEEPPKQIATADKAPAPAENIYSNTISEDTAQTQLKNIEELKQRLRSGSVGGTTTTAKDTKTAEVKTEEHHDPKVSTTTAPPKKTKKRQVLKGYLKLQDTALEDNQLFVILNNGSHITATAGMALQLKYKRKWTDIRVEISNSQWYLIVTDTTNINIKAGTAEVMEDGKMVKLYVLSKLEVRPAQDIETNRVIIEE